MLIVAPLVGHEETQTVEWVPMLLHGLLSWDELSISNLFEFLISKLGRQGLTENADVITG